MSDKMTTDDMINHFKLEASNTCPICNSIIARLLEANRMEVFIPVLERRERITAEALNETVARWQALREWAETGELHRNYNLIAKMDELEGEKE